MIRYIVGDAANDPQSGLIVHVCNDIGAWGAGFVIPLGKRFPHARRKYQNWALSNERFEQENFVQRGLHRLPLGAVQWIEIQPNLVIGNMIAQRGIVSQVSNSIPLQYDALADCLRLVGVYARVHDLAVHMPRIGCGLAGGTWDQVGPLVEQELAGVDVMVYDLPASVA